MARKVALLRCCVAQRYEVGSGEDRETVTRLLDMGLDPYSFGDSLLGVLALLLGFAVAVATGPVYAEQGVATRTAAVAMERPALGGASLDRQEGWPEPRGVSFFLSFFLIHDRLSLAEDHTRHRRQPRHTCGWAC